MFLTAAGSIRPRCTWMEKSFGSAKICNYEAGCAGGIRWSSSSAAVPDAVGAVAHVLLPRERVCVFGLNETGFDSRHSIEALPVKAARSKPATYLIARTARSLCDR